MPSNKHWPSLEGRSLRSECAQPAAQHHRTCTHPLLLLYRPALTPVCATPPRASPRPRRLPATVSLASCMPCVAVAYVGTDRQAAACHRMSSPVSSAPDPWPRASTCRCCGGCRGAAGAGVSPCRALDIGPAGLARGHSSGGGCLLPAACCPLPLPTYCHAVPCFGVSCYTAGFGCALACLAAPRVLHCNGHCSHHSSSGVGCARQ